MNETLNTIFKRSSTRGYTDEKLTEEELSVLADAALASPTAINKQEWHFTFVGAEIVDKIEKTQLELVEKSGDSAAKERIASRKGKVLYNAPLMIIISIDKNFKWSECDAGIAVENISLAAESLGLGSVIIGCIEQIFESDRKTEFEKLLCFPDNYKFGIAVAIGHKATSKEQHEKDYSKITKLL